MDFLIAKTLLLCSFLLLGACAAPAPDHEHDFSYDNKSPTGPSNWGNIKPEWRTCSAGKRQSPIDISDCRAVIAPKLGRLKRHYKPSKATLLNLGHVTAVKWKEGGGCINISGILYELKQCHWHVPSEHLINGRRFDLEIHLVHKSLSGNIAVVGKMYKIGRPDPFLCKIEHYIKQLVNTTGEERAIGYVHPDRINIGNGKYYRYKGSLTTPPCKENVVWTLMRKVGTVSREQVELIRDALAEESKTDARPIQPVNNRLIKFYKPKRRHPIF